jgi:hypothetical protein
MMNTLRLVTPTTDDSLLLPNVRLLCMRGMYRHDDTPDDPLCRFMPVLQCELRPRKSEIVSDAGAGDQTGGLRPKPIHGIT